MGNTHSMHAFCLVAPRINEYDGCPKSIKHCDIIEQARRPKPFGGLPSNTPEVQLRQIKIMEDHLDPQQRHLLQQRIDEKLPENMVKREINMQRAVFWLSWGSGMLTSYSGYQFLKKLRIKLWMRSSVATIGCVGVAEFLHRTMTGNVCRDEFRRYKDMREQVTLEVAGAEARRFMRYHRAPGTQRLDPEYRMRLTGGVSRNKLIGANTVRENWVEQKLQIGYGEWEKIITPPVSEGLIPDPKDRFYNDVVSHIRCAMIPHDWYPPELECRRGDDDTTELYARFGKIRKTGGSSNSTNQDTNGNSDNESDTSDSQQQYNYNIQELSAEDQLIDDVVEEVMRQLPPETQMGITVSDTQNKNDSGNKSSQSQSQTSFNMNNPDNIYHSNSDSDSQSNDFDLTSDIPTSFQSNNQRNRTQQLKKEIKTYVKNASIPILAGPLEEARLRALDRVGALSEFGQPRGDMNDDEIEKARLAVDREQRKVLGVKESSSSGGTRNSSDYMSGGSTNNSESDSESENQVNANIPQSSSLYRQLVESGLQMVQGAVEHQNAMTSFVKDFAIQCREEFGEEVPAEHMRTAIVTALEKKVKQIRDLFEERHAKKRKKGEILEPKHISRHMIEQLQDKQKLLLRETEYWLRHLADMDEKVEDTRRIIQRAIKQKINSAEEDVDEETLDRLKRTLLGEIKPGNENGNGMTETEIERTILSTNNNLFHLTYGAWKEEELYPLGNYSYIEGWAKAIEESLWLYYLTEPLELNFKTYQKKKITNIVEGKAKALAHVYRQKLKRPGLMTAATMECYDARIRAEIMRQKQADQYKKLATISKKIESKGQSFISRWLWG